jgi:hypothetical protein
LYQTTLGALREELVQYTQHKGKIFLLFDNVDKAWNANGLDERGLRLKREGFRPRQATRYSTQESAKPPRTV